MLKAASDAAGIEQRKYMDELAGLKKQLEEAQDVRDNEATEFVKQLHEQKKLRIEGQKVIEKATEPADIELKCVAIIKAIKELEAEKVKATDALRQKKVEAQRFQQEAGPLNEELGDCQREMLEYKEEKLSIEKRIVTTQARLKELQNEYAKKMNAKK